MTVDVAEPGAIGDEAAAAGSAADGDAPAAAEPPADKSAAHAGKGGGKDAARDAEAKRSAKDARTESKADTKSPKDKTSDSSGAGTSKSGAGGATASGGGATKTDDKPKDDLDRSIEDLLNSPVEKKKVDKPDKTELTSHELRAGLADAAGAAKACYGKYGIAGTVKVKLTIDPSGKVSKAAATGDFAGTPSGTCVAAALKQASFPAWSGAPMSTTYAVLLAE
ncbi:MAG: hypothetical protein H6709_02905 [Kofleriaceae bacterium]|nr:hypothetical protein [Kofleriaceae bacterium]